MKEWYAAIKANLNWLILLYALYDTLAKYFPKTFCFDFICQNNKTGLISLVLAIVIVRLTKQLQEKSKQLELFKQSQVTVHPTQET